MFRLWKCPNTECWWSGYGNEGEFCPECGKRLEKFGLRKGNKLMQAKKKVPKPKKEKPVKEVKKVNQPQTDVLKGLYKGSDGILTLKNDRLELNARGTFGAWAESKEVKYSDITSIQMSKDLFKNRLEIKYYGGDLILSHFNDKVGELFVENVRNKMQSSAQKVEPTSNPAASPMDEIKKAKKLLDMGAITEEQFEEIRDNYLKEIK
jgi:hypothetical protein